MMDTPDRLAKITPSRFRFHWGRGTTWLGIGLLFTSCGQVSTTPPSAEQIETVAKVVSTRRDLSPLAQEAQLSSDPEVSCPAIDWAPNLDEAFVRAENEKKPILLAFSARQQEASCGNEF